MCFENLSFVPILFKNFMAIFLPLVALGPLAIFASLHILRLQHDEFIHLNRDKLSYVHKAAHE